MTSATLLLALSLLVQDPEQGPQDEPPPKPVVEVPGAPPFAPRPEYPFLGGFTARTLAMRPRFQLTTREYDVGMLSGKYNFGETADFDRTAFAWDATLDLGRWIITLTAMHQENESRLDSDTVFEQHRFLAGSRAKSVAFFGTLEAFHKFDLLGGPAETFHVSFLAGVNLSKLYLMMRAGDAEASEGFSALWPLPAIGIEARIWLSERLAIDVSARGTRIRYDNPFQLDGGGSQDIRYLYGRFDAGLEWTLSEAVSIEAGYTGIDAHIKAASAEDTDDADLKAGGVHAGLTLRF